jgi:outer membrane protein
MQKLKCLSFFTLCSMFILSFPISGTAQTSEQMTLTACIDYALKNNYEVQKAKLDQDESSYLTKEIKGSGLPQIKGTAGVDNYLSLPTSILPGEIIGAPGTHIPVKFGTKYVASAGIEASQMIFNPAYFVGIKAAKSVEELYRIKSQLTEEEVIYQVSTLYYDILNSTQQLQSVQSNIQKIDSLYSLTDSQYKNDLARKVDLNRIKVNRTSLQVTLNNIEAAIAQQKNYLQILMGMPVQTDISLDSSPIGIESIYQDYENSYDPSKHSTIHALNQQKELLTLEKKSIQSQYLPTLNAFGSYSVQAQRNKFDLLDGQQPWFDVAVIGLKFNLPIFDGFQKRNKIMQSKVKIEKLEKDLQQTTESINMEFENSKTLLSISYNSIRVQEDNVQLAEEVYDQTRLMYQEGLGGLTELLDAEAALREAKIAFTSEVIKYKKARLNMIKAEGNLSNYSTIL